MISKIDEKSIVTRLEVTDRDSDWNQRGLSYWDSCMINFAYEQDNSCYKDPPPYVIQTTTTIKPKTKPVTPIQTVARVQCGVSKTSNLRFKNEVPGARVINPA